jgi:hypothetical protein
MKKIVILPTFGEVHLIKHQIPNIIDTINPDYIIYNEGMFPKGPESSTTVNDEFIKNYTLDGKRGFDYEELKEVIVEAQKKYPNTKIILNEMNYPDGLDAPNCYRLACSNFKELGIDVESGDYIFPYEGDVFHHEKDKNLIQGYLEQLTPNTGFKSNWIDFVENQFYCERSTLKPFLDQKEGRHRRIAICFGTWEFYEDVLLNFMTQKYPMLYPTDLLTYHYCWWRPGKYKQLRYDQLNRDKIYWENFDIGLEQIKRNTEDGITSDVVLRPDRADHLTHKWASFIEIEHPKHIKQHPNFVK